MWLVEELDEEIFAGFLTFLEISGKTCYAVFHSRSMPAMSFCRLTWKEKLVKVAEVLTDKFVARSVEEAKA